MKKVIITGCCRSGQRRTRSAFGQVKVSAGYESDLEGADITIGWMLAADGDDYMGAHEPYWNREVDEVWHLVRDPMGCIPSMADTIKASLWMWQHRYTGLHPASPAFPSRRMFASLFWVKWNELAEQRHPSFRYRVENLNEAWPQMWERLGEPLRPMDSRSEEYQGAIRDRSRIPSAPMTYDEIKSWSPSVCDDVRRMAARYGYSDED